MRPSTRAFALAAVTAVLGIALVNVAIVLPAGHDEDVASFNAGWLICLAVVAGGIACSLRAEEGDG